MAEMVQSWAGARSDELRAYSRCVLCEHRCGVNRIEGEKGVCGAGGEPKVFRWGLEYGEERALTPSLLIYLAGCDMRCAYCISGEAVEKPEQGQGLNRELFGRILDAGLEQGARTIQFSGGQPTPFAPTIAKLVKGEKQRRSGGLPQVVWKSNLHESMEALEAIVPAVDIFLADLKYGNDGCARRLSEVGNYLEVAGRNMRWMASRRRLIIRHLVLPGHEACCRRAILRWLREELPQVELSVREGYLPAWRAGQFIELARLLGHQEWKQAVDEAERLGLRVIE